MAYTGSYTFSDIAPALGDLVVKTMTVMISLTSLIGIWVVIRLFQGKPIMPKLK